jgi:hypothetical protein
MLKFLVQTFFQPLFSHTFPFSNFPLAILFPFKSFPHQKAQSKRIKPKPQKTQAPKTLQSQRQKAKSLKPSFSRPVANKVEQRLLGRGVTL